MPSYFPVVTFALPDGRVALTHGMATVGSLGCFATGLRVTFLAFGVAVLLGWVLLRLVLQVSG